MSEAVIIWSSTRKDSNTLKSIQEIQKHVYADDIYLADYDFSFFDYEAKNLQDDFEKISKQILRYKTLIFATPVYWYSMEARMKIFFDRLSDLISARKEDGRALAGKNVFLIANGTGETLPDGFEVPFCQTANYFDMIYNSCHYWHTGKNDALSNSTWENIKDFAEGIKNAR